MKALFLFKIGEIKILHLQPSNALFHFNSALAMKPHVNPKACECYEYPLCYNADPEGWWRKREREGRERIGGDREREKERQRKRDLGKVGGRKRDRGEG